MKCPPVITIDFETLGIEQRPKYPPTPVGVAIKWPGKRARYYAWGHPTHNNSTVGEATAALRECIKSNYALLCHNAKFDMDVMQSNLGLTMPSWERIHDTMFLLFLQDPHAQSFSLKPSAERILGMAPEEQEAVRDWLYANNKCRGREWGAFIAQAPGNLVGKYAIGDVDRTEKLFRHLWPEIDSRGMMKAYDIERQLMPIVLDNERQGINVDLRRLEHDFSIYQNNMLVCDIWLRKRLKAPDLNIDSDRDLAEALDKAGIVTDWVLTPKGQKSVSKDNLTPSMFKDKRVATALGYRTRLNTCMGTFMEPWLIVARETNGIIHTNWNQVRQYSRGSKNKGTRTGRLSSSPNFQNIPVDFYDKADGYSHPDHLDILTLPHMRDYIVPDKGTLWAKRDYNQQELRILAHFEEDVLRAAYNDNPRMDVHDFVKGKITEIVHKDYERRKVKLTNFGIIYGQGKGSLAEAMQCTVEEAYSLKQAHKKALPGVAALEKQLKEIGKSNEPIITWGGREYYCEPPAMINGRKATFEYKLLNYLIQGSAADQTKLSIIRYNEMKKAGRFLVTVHDEINISVPPKHLKAEMKILKEAMEDMPTMDVPMLSDGETGKTWGTLEDYVD